MADFYFPSLSDDGWITNSVKIADQMLAHFYAANFSQSYIYAGQVASFPYVLAVNQGDFGAITSETRAILTKYFSRVFSQVNVTVEEIPNEDNPSKGQIEIAIAFTGADGQAHTIGEIVQLQDSSFERIVKINNG